ncbi:MAG: DUF4404 family protein [Gemmatimonadota bacterium]
MNPKSLHDLVAELHQALTSTKEVDPGTREQLQRLASDIRPILDAGPGDKVSEQYAPLRGRLTDSLTDFEASHPQLAKTVANLLDALALYNL